MLEHNEPGIIQVIAVVLIMLVMGSVIWWVGMRNGKFTPRFGVKVVEVWK